jgi:putative hydrolase of the HAD superfamily
MIHAVAFDMDDTLYPERSFVFSGYRAVSQAVEAQLGFPIYDDLVQLFESGRRGDLFTPVLAQHRNRVEESYVRSLVAVYRAHSPTIVPFPETNTVLRSIRRRYRTALISDGLQEVQDRKLDALGLRAHFEVILMTGELGKEFWKPHPLAFEECARRLSVATARMAYVGDNPAKDFMTARRLGFRTIRVRRPGTLHFETEPPPAQEADVTVETLSGVPEVIEGLD